MLVSFSWNDKEFAVKPTLEVYEIKNRRIFVTGASTLLSFELKKKENNGKLFTEAAESLFQAESMFQNGSQSESGFELLESVKRTLRGNLGKLIPASRSSARPEALVAIG